MKKIATALVVVALGLNLNGCQSKISNKLVLGDYKGIYLETDQITIGQKDIQDEITYELSEYIKYEKVTNGGAKIGDIVTVDYEGKVDKVKRDELCGTNKELILGSNEFLIEFENGLVDHSIGEVVDVVVQFPADYSVYPGEKVEFTIKLKNVERTKLPNITNEFIQSATDDCKSTEEFTEKIKQKVYNNYKEIQDQELKEKLFTNIIEDTQFIEYSEADRDKIADEIMAGYTSYAKYQNISYEECFANIWKSEQEFKEYVDVMYKKGIICRQIAENEKLDISEEAYKQYVDKSARELGYSNSDMYVKLNSQILLKHQFIEKVVSDYLLDAADIVYTPTNK